MSPQASESGSDFPLGPLTYLWDEYKYRHGLCWSAVYKVAAAVVALAMVPYAKDDLTKLLGYGMVVPPLVGTAIAAFGIHLVNNELDLFARIKLAYHTMQGALFQAVLNDPDTAQAATHQITPANMKSTRFDTYVRVFILGLLAISAANTLYVALRWIPHMIKGG